MIKKILKISFVGKTNAGKSTLINNIVGEIVSISNKKINTTQDLIIGIKNIKNIQLVFYDTPGLSFLKAKHKNKKNLTTNLWLGIDQSNIILFLIDSKTFNINEITNFLNQLTKLNKKIFIVFNKIDLIKRNHLMQFIKLIDSKFKIDAFFNISAKYNIGISELINYLSKKSIKSKWIYKKDEISNKNDVFITNECTRNAILTFLHKEIPYNIKIINESFKFLNNGDLKIKQKLLIKDMRYKKIILGNKGEKIKSIRESSQSQIKKILNTNIHLYLEVLKSYD